LRRGPLQPQVYKTGRARRQPRFTSRTPTSMSRNKGCGCGTCENHPRGTHQVLTSRKFMKNTHRKRTSVTKSEPCALNRKSEAEWQEIKRLFLQGVPNQAIAREHGISEGAIRKRAKRERWKQVWLAEQLGPAAVQPDADWARGAAALSRRDDARGDRPRAALSRKPSRQGQRRWSRSDNAHRISKS
jgi:hypothetical protein